METPVLVKCNLQSGWDVSDLPFPEFVQAQALAAAFGADGFSFGDRKDINASREMFWEVKLHNWNSVLECFEQIGIVVMVLSF